MLLHNSKFTVTDVTDQEVTLESELKQEIKVAKDFLEKVQVGDTVYLAADHNPLNLTSAKEIVNEMIDGQEETSG